ncbi:MAG: hypothetical protein RL145_152, partial [Pseudomonadota bacterium]
MVSRRSSLRSLAVSVPILAGLFGTAKAVPAASTPGLAG